MPNTSTTHQQNYAPPWACVALTLIILIVIAIKLINALAFIAHNSEATYISFIAILAIVIITGLMFFPIPRSGDHLIDTIKFALRLGPHLLPPRWQRYSMTAHATTILIAIYCLQGLMDTYDYLHKTPNQDSTQWKAFTIGVAGFIILGAMLLYKHKKHRQLNVER